MDPVLDYARREPVSHRWNAQTRWRVAGLVVFVFVIFATMTIMTSSPVWVFFDPAGAAVVVGGTAALLVMTFGAAGVSDALATLVGGPRRLRRRAKAAACLRRAAVYALGCGCIGTLIGLVVVLRNVGYPEGLGPPIAFALLTQLYGVLLALLYSSDSERSRCVDDTK